MRLSSVGVLGSSYRSAMARTKAAKPAAELARPAAVGKLFVDTIRRGYVDNGGSEESAASRAARRERRARRHACVLGVWISCACELRTRVSTSGKWEEHDAVVCVRRSRCDSVTEREELVGRLSAGSRFPQYLCAMSLQLVSLHHIA